MPFKTRIRLTAFMENVEEYPCQFGYYDSRTSALFIAEPFYLASGGFDTPYYMREMSILEKIKKKPGISIETILARFSEWERDEMFPPLTPILLDLMLDELVQTGYVDVRDGKAHPGNRDNS